MEISIDSIESILMLKPIPSNPAYLISDKCNGVACVAINKGKSIKGFHLVYA